jgi:hypothetical protein
MKENEEGEGSGGKGHVVCLGDATCIHSFGPDCTRKMPLEWLGHIDLVA